MESQSFKDLQKLGSRYGLNSQIEYLNRSFCIEFNLGTTLKIATENETWQLFSMSVKNQKTHIKCLLTVVLDLNAGGVYFETSPCTRICLSVLGYINFTGPLRSRI